MASVEKASTAGKSRWVGTESGGVQSDSEVGEAVQGPSSAHTPLENNDDCSKGT